MNLFRKENYIIGLKDEDGWEYFYEDTTYGVETTRSMGEILVFDSKREALDWWERNKNVIFEKFENEKIKKISIRKFKDEMVLKEY